MNIQSDILTEGTESLILNNTIHCSVTPPLRLAPKIPSGCTFHTTLSLSVVVCFSKQDRKHQHMTNQMEISP